ncbi:RRQRL motif-containing zinc-binding protein [Kitasatospora sp. NPDC092948]|uniref:RRQRL motif-containing zinc-binding protein n=1 Tax=Kitasatospora sp. NPDC092948 TaxID=3364088 RepID=UPI00380D0C32
MPLTPSTTATVPVYRWKCAPNGLATRRQLRAQGLRPGGQPVVGEIVWRRGRRVAHLYRVADAAPVRPMTPGKHAALAAAMTARRTCPACERDAGYVIPPSLGTCWPCSDEATAA